MPPPEPASLTDDQARTLLARAAGTVDVGPTGPRAVDPGPRRRTARLVAAAAAAVVAIGLALTLVPTADRGPSSPTASTPPLRPGGLPDTAAVADQLVAFALGEGPAPVVADDGVEVGMVGAPTRGTYRVAADEATGPGGWAGAHAATGPDVEAPDPLALIAGEAERGGVVVGGAGVECRTADTGYSYNVGGSVEDDPFGPASADAATRIVVVPARASCLDGWELTIGVDLDGSLSWVGVQLNRPAGQPYLRPEVPTTPSEVAQAVVQYTGGMRAALPVADTLDLYLDHDLRTTLSADEAGDPTVWSLDGDTDGGVSGPFNPLEILARTAQVVDGATLPASPCLPAAASPGPVVDGTTAVRLRPAGASCIDDVEVVLYVDDAARIRAVDLLVAAP